MNLKENMINTDTTTGEEFVFAESITGVLDPNTRNMTFTHRDRTALKDASGVTHITATSPVEHQHVILAEDMNTPEPLRNMETGEIVEGETFTPAKAIQIAYSLAQNRRG